MKKYIKIKNWNGSTTLKRMVNQTEIVEYLKRNPYRSENEIMYDLYKFTRGGFDSNKKYADCLRRALYSGKIDRIKITKVDNQSWYFYFIPKQNPKHPFTEWLRMG